MSKGTEMKPQDSSMSLSNLYNLLRDVLSQNQSKDKNFVKNELKFKPLIEVSKHTFDDGCSPLAMIDFTVLQGAYKHYLENKEDCLKQETAVLSSSYKNRWKGRIFVSRRDSSTAGTSEDSDLERTLCELPMTEIINNISPELLDSCNKEFGRSSLFNKSVPVTELSPSVSFSPFQNTEDVSKSQDILEKVGLSEVFDLPHVEENDQTEISRDVRRKRKKCKRKIVLERNVNSTDSSEMLSPPSEIHVNELENAEKVLCDTEQLNQYSLSTQEQMIDSTVLISPTNIGTSKNQKELRKSPKAKAESTKKGKVLTQSSKEIFIMPNSTKPLQTSINRQDNGKNQCEVLQSPEIFLSGPQAVFHTSEGQAEKPSTIPKAVLQNQSPTITSQAVDSEKTMCRMRQETPKSICAGIKMVNKLVNHTHKAKSPESKSYSKEDAHQKPSEVLNELLNSSQALISKSPKSGSNSKEDTHQKPSEVLDKLLNSSQTLKSKSPKSRSNSKEDTRQKPSEVLSKLISSNQSPKVKSLKSRSNFKEGAQETPSEVNAGQILKSKSPRSKSNPEKNRSQMSCDTVKDSLSLQTDTVKCDTYAIEKECAEVFENHHITLSLSDSGFTESEKDGDKNSNISISPVDDFCCDAEVSAFFNENTENQTSLHPGSRQEVVDNNMDEEVDNHKIVAPEAEPPKLDLNSLPVTSNVDDNYDLLDFECDDISEPEEMAPIRKSPEGEPDSYSADEDIHSKEEYSCYSEVTGGCTPGQELCPTSDRICSPLSENVSSLTNQQEKNYNEVFGDTNKKENGAACKLPWNPPRSKTLTKRRRSFSDDDDSSASDSETSYKRRKESSPSQPQQRQENITQASSSWSKFDVSEPRLRNLNSVIQDIEINCDNHNILKAVNSVSEYLKISDRPTCLKIFQEIFLGIRDSVRFTNIDPEDPLVEIIEKLKSFVDNSTLGNREDNIKLCSMVIYEFFQVPALIRYALDLCCYLQTKSVPVRNRAIDAFATNAISRKAPTDIILNFLAYIKKTCQLPVHQPLLKHVLQRVVRGKECYMLPEFSQLCEFLCLLDAYEMERLPLQELIKICIENNCWDVIARLFIAWCDKKCFPTPFLEALQSKLDEIGIGFKKFAADTLGAGEPSESTKYFFGIIGVTLIMDCCKTGREKPGKPKKEYLVEANNVLHTLHKYNVDIFHVMKSFFRADWPADPYPCLVLHSPYLVFFNLVEICLHLNLPKNAFQLYKNYSSYLNELPQALNDVEKSSIRIMQFTQFTMVTHSLHLKDPLESGLSAFHHLMQLSKHEDILKQMKTSHRIYPIIERIFANLLVTCMNKLLTATLNQLFQYISDSRDSPWEPILMPKREVLRGLVVTLAKCDKMEQALSLFSLGCANRLYLFERPTVIPWELTLLSCWTNQEMKLVVEKYFNLLFPSLSQKKSKIKFEDWYTVKINFKEVPSPPPKISCLIVPSVPTPLSRGCSVITSINPDLRWTKHGNFILLTPSTVYNHWYNVSTKNYSKVQETTFNASQSRPLVFGMDVDNELYLISRRTPETSAFSPNQSSSSQQSTPSYRYQTPSNDQPSSQNSFLHPNVVMKRNASFSSSERSSSDTPDCGTSVEREPQRSGLKRPFEPSSSESDKVDNESSYAEGPASKLRRTDSGDMSQLSNFYCRKVSPRKTPPQQQYPVSSHQSQTRTDNHQTSPRTGWNQFDRNPSYQLAPQTGHNQFDRNASHQSSSQPGQNNFDRNASHRSPSQTGRNQFDGNASHRSPSQTGRNQFDGNAIHRSPSQAGRNQYDGNASHQSQPGRNNFDRNASHQLPPQSGPNQFDVRKPNNFAYSRTSPGRTSQVSVASSCLNTGLDQSQNTTPPLPPPGERFQSTVRPDQNRNMENFRVTQPAQFDSSDTPPNDCLRPYKNISSRPPLLMSPPNHFAMASPYPSDELELSQNSVKRNLNVDIAKSTALKVTADVFKPPPKQKVAKNQAPKNQTHREPATPKSKQYRIPTPCKAAKVKRSFTPVCNKPAFRGKFLTVSIGNNSSRRTVAAPNNRGPAPRQTILGPPQAVPSSVPPDVFEKIIAYIEIAVRHLHKESLNDLEKHEKAIALAKTFVEKNSVTELNKETRRLLVTFGTTIK